jgi:UDP-N-acetylmuramate: L-alanyl-gamma-D-glutamyl-meso-diaminopimelate ligase
MHVHILGICGTFMGGIAALARAAGHRVTGADKNVYPPMSTQLESLGIEIFEGYGEGALDASADVVVVGNVMTRGMPVIEALLDSGQAYTSGPEWLARHVLAERWVLAVAGTHGKTTTSSVLAWLLEDAGLDPGFLIGGVPGNFGISARLGSDPFFVVEADEYDTAFFDKRSKFVHYRPRTLILNNLEFDHADIFPDLAAIKRQFHHLVRTVPGSGLIVANGAEANLAAVLEMGCWTPVETFSGPGGGGAWQVGPAEDGGWELAEDPKEAGSTAVRFDWEMPGLHNAENALAAVLAARHAGVPLASSLDGLGRFKGIRRRMELRGEVAGITVFDDFAHHPTAIARTLEGVRRLGTAARVVAVVEPRSNTMRMGVHVDELGESLAEADEVFLFRPPGLDWDLDGVAARMTPSASVSDSIETLLDRLVSSLRRGDHVVVMSNGGFGGVHQKLIDALAARETQ